VSEFFSLHIEGNFEEFPLKLFGEREFSAKNSSPEKLELSG
jgi:hypothetical protein